jgi:two-component system response regulator AtoC
MDEKRAKYLFHKLFEKGKEDIPLLAGHFVSQYSQEFDKPQLRLSRKAEAVLQNYDWQGSVWELKSLFGKVCLMEDEDVIKPQHVPGRLRKSQEEVIFLP